MIVIQKPAMPQFEDCRIASEHLRLWASAEANRPFFNCGGDWYSFGEAESISAAVAGGLRSLGIVKGDRVAVLLPNCDANVLAILALARLGAIQVPLNIYLRGEFLLHQLVDSQARALITDAAGFGELDKIRDRLNGLDFVVVVSDDDTLNGNAVAFHELRNSGANAPDVAIDPRDAMAIMYTSGTTGPSKGCILSHGYYISLPRGWFLNDWYRTDDRLLTATPLFHISGQGMTLMSAILGGMPLTLLQEFSASRFIEECNRAQATAAFGVGPMGAAILATPERPVDRDHDLRVAIFPPMAPPARAEFTRRFGVPVVSGGYGQTECNPITQSPLTDQDQPSGSLGLPVPWLDVRLVDDDDIPVRQGEVGEIVVRPREPMVMYDGYWRNPAATLAASRDLWHHTGDYARQNDDGYLIYVDRKRDAMRRRGENVSSIEVENAIRKHPQISAVAAHGVPSPLGEDDIKVWIVLEPDAAGFTPEALHKYLAENLPYFAIPRYVEFTDALPVNALGRVLKYQLRARPPAGGWDFEELKLTVDKAARR